MSEDYKSHADYMDWVRNDTLKRVRDIEDDLRRAFSNVIEIREVEVIVFSSLTPADIADAIYAYPRILKPLLAACNIAARAIERDLSIRNLDTYNPRITEDEVKIVAGYITPFLPPYIEIPALLHVDKIAFIDKEIRKVKGNWEKEILRALSRYSRFTFAKRMFSVGGEEFEIDAAVPEAGIIDIGIDIKRIEARRDIHKRCDEISNKALKLKEAFPGAKFGVVIYYPFIDEHTNVQNRLRSQDIDMVVFASASKESIENAVRILLSSFGVSK
jgi:hypothetical protein